MWVPSLQHLPLYTLYFFRLWSGVHYFVCNTVILSPQPKKQFGRQTANSMIVIRLHIFSSLTKLAAGRQLSSTRNKFYYLLYDNAFDSTIFFNFSFVGWYLTRAKPCSNLFYWNNTLQSYYCNIVLHGTPDIQYVLCKRFNCNLIGRIQIIAMLLLMDHHFLRIF